ncbi:hypothetical protein DMA11_05105 [Marinilabiliaceae bacterium JC017]|nr:hypothetical protein DMA11_05105 [Marinilabiliaceae bacterium JC017]
MNQFTSAQLIMLGIIIFVILWTLLIGRFWLKALLSGIRITPLHILMMRLRGTPVSLVLNELIKAVKSGIVIDINELEACTLGGGNLKNVVDGLIYAKHKGIEFTIKDAMQIDIERRDVVKYLRNK